MAEPIRWQRRPAEQYPLVLLPVVIIGDGGDGGDDGSNGICCNLLVSRLDSNSGGNCRSSNQRWALLLIYHNIRTLLLR